MTVSKRTLALVLVGLFLVSFFIGKQYRDEGVVEPIESQTLTVSIGDHVFDAIVVDSPASRAQGLSGRLSLEDRTGMLFVFETPGIHGFWMKDMLFSIDIVWIDEGNKIVHIEKDVHPDTYPTSFVPNDPALYVFEINAGISDEIGLQLGQEVEFIR